LPISILEKRWSFTERKEKMARLTKKNKKDLGAEAARFFGNCGQIAINGPAYNESENFIGALEATSYVYASEIERILEEMRTLNVIMETLQQGNQYDPQKLAGKCPKLIIEAKLEGFHIGAEWW
jgi:hypothetical protein